ncbi:helix-turn-helix domain-containing protein [Croceiramulus getboli]|nr:AraC family transcriptional regulator [Flavobacteriaceae bacterium YJPT1-3]
MNFIIVLFLFFAFLGVLIGFFFFLKKKGDRLANGILGLYTILFAFELINNCLRWSGDLNTATFVHLNFTHFPLWLVYGPLVYIYVRRVITTKGLQKTDLVFLIPPLIVIGLMAPFYRLSAAAKLDVLQEGTIREHVFFPSYTIWIIIAFMFFYAGLTYLTFKRRKEVGFRESKWLQWFVGSYLGFVLAFFAYFFLIRFEIMDPQYDYFIDLAIVLFISLLAFFGFVQPEVFDGKSLQEVVPFVKYRKTGITESLALEMMEKLMRIMDEEKPYLDNELRLDDLADRLNLSRNNASQIINEQFNRSFFDFVNEYRIEEAKRLIEQGALQESTVAQLAYDVGFNNRASFYKAFKKFAQGSPKEYMEHANAS